MKRGLRAAISVVSLLVPASAAAQAGVRTIHVVPGSHFDLGYTDTPSRVMEWRILVLDEAVQRAIDDPAFHWFEEAAIVWDAWWSVNREEDELLEHVRRLFRNGQLGVGATWVTPVSGAMPEAFRLLSFHLDELEAAFGYRPSVAVLNDVPAFPEAVVDALAAAGVRYLLMGANMFISNPLPAHLVRQPFWWESSSGARVLAYIDPSSYIAAMEHWGIGPGCARGFAPQRFPSGLDDVETMRRGITTMLGETTAAYDAVVVQQAFDNWGTECARDLPAAATLWNATNGTPRIVVSQPEAYFRHIEARYGDGLPVHRGSGSYDWDHQAAAIAPVTRWRLRQAARAIVQEVERADVPDRAELRRRIAAVAAAVDHTGPLGPGGPFLTEWQVRSHARQWGRIVERALRMALGADGPALVPPRVDVAPDRTLAHAPWAALLAAAPLLRAGPRLLATFIRGDEALDAPVEVRADGRRAVIHAAVDRTRVPGADQQFVNVVLDIPLRAPPGTLELAVAGADSQAPGLRGEAAGLRGEAAWLRGQPPRPLMAPDGLLVRGLASTLRVTSPLVVSWMLVSDPDDPGVTRLRGYVAGHSTHAEELRGGGTLQLPFDQMYPGEPSVLDVQVVIELAEASAPPVRLRQE